jgi:DNA polymerase delta subunit 2
MSFDSKFNVKSIKYVQYNHMYLQRLISMRPVLLELAKKRWKLENNVVHDRLINCEISQGQISTIIGTIFKQMDLKPSVILNSFISHFN